MKLVQETRSLTDHLIDIAQEVQEAFILDLDQDLTLDQDLPLAQEDMALFPQRDLALILTTALKDLIRLVQEVQDAFILDLDQDLTLDQDLPLSQEDMVLFPQGDLALILTTALKDIDLLVQEVLMKEFTKYQ